ncbi:MAG: hypothetical protein H3C30_11480 [Candidatus Hydrogenedentes bacterium]|nr:hypothetical protein [Candidatus Hydrogenedentota bacterium]
MDKKHVVHVISNTHWDREWLFNFQETRMMLVDLFDRMLDIFDKHPDYRSFVMDSQAVPVEDYLEIRPENRKRIEKAVRKGRLLLGPWYTCPEGFEVNGESLVRNLTYGHRVAGEFGGVMKVGHTPFSYGQNSQMPQIYAGFGIDTVLFYHGVSRDEAKNEFILEGADGTRALGSQMSSFARYNFYHHVYRAALYGKNIADREYEWSECGLPFRRCAPGQEAGHFFLLDPVRGLDLERAAEKIKWLRESELGVATTRHLAFMMGHDSSLPDEAELDLIRLAKEALPEDEVRHGFYPDMMAAIKAEADWQKLAVLRGEQRVPKPMPVTMHLYSDVLSSRTRMKSRCADAEYLLQRRAEPLAVLASWLGADWPGAYLDLAWKTLLKCHAHDSISGSGVDAIEEDMMNRLNQVIHLSEGLVSRSLGAVQLQINTGETGTDDVLVTVFNAQPQARSEVVTAILDLPYRGPRGEFTLTDPQTGKSFPVQAAARKPHWSIVNHAWDAPAMVRSERFTVHFPAEAVPGLGYAVLKVDRSGAFARGSMVCGANAMENEHLRVRIANDGTLSVTHKSSGVTYTDLNYFVDNGEAGHAWMHHNPARDRALDSRGFPVRIALEEDGPLLARYRVEVMMEVPARLDENGGDPWQRLDGIGNSASRAEGTRPLRIVSRITLRRGAKSVAVDVSFDNTVEDHRLRVFFPTRRPGKVCRVESAFDVISRDTVFGPDSPWHNCQGVTFPMQRFVDVSDGAAGLAFISRGLREYEVTQDAERAIAVTLLRAYEVNLTTVSCRWDAHPEMKLAQAPGAHAFSYLICPHAGYYAAGGVVAEAERFVTPLEPAQAGAHPGGLPARMGFLEMEPDILTFSALKRAENGDGWIVRVANPTMTAMKGKLHFGQTPVSAEMVSLEEVSEKELPVKNNTVVFTAGPKKIVTIRVRL